MATKYKPETIARALGWRKTSREPYPGSPVDRECWVIPGQEGTTSFSGSFPQFHESLDDLTDWLTRREIKWSLTPVKDGFIRGMVWKDDSNWYYDHRAKRPIDALVEAFMHCTRDKRRKK